jgi:hypothetical protein
MRTTRVPWLPLMLALVIAFAGTVVLFGKSAAQASVAAGDVALHQAAKKKIVNLAKDSKKLGGKPPSAYLDRVAFKSAAAIKAVPAAATELVGGTNITVPGAIKFVRVTGNSTFFGGAANYVLWFEVDDNCDLDGVGFDNRAFGNTTQQENSTVDFVVPVTPGVHTFRLCGLGAAGVSTISKTLVVETIAKGATGGNTLAKAPSRLAPDRDSNPVTPR